jgi:hypothetical protein
VICITSLSLDRHSLASFRLYCNHSGVSCNPDIE